MRQGPRSEKELRFVRYISISILDADPVLDLDGRVPATSEQRLKPCTDGARYENSLGHRSLVKSNVISAHQLENSKFLINFGRKW